MTPNINTRLFLFWSMNQECHVDEEKESSRMQSQAKWCGAEGSVPTSSLPFTLKEVYATLHLFTFILTAHQWNMLKVLASATRPSSLELDHHLELVARVVEGLRRVTGTHGRLFTFTVVTFCDLELPGFRAWALPLISSVTSASYWASITCSHHPERLCDLPKVTQRMAKLDLGSKALDQRLQRLPWG